MFAGVKILYALQIAFLLCLGFSAGASEHVEVSTVAPQAPNLSSDQTDQKQILYPSAGTPKLTADRVDPFQYAVNFGLVQVTLGGFNISAELRYNRLWLAYQHGVGLTLNKASSVGLSKLAMSPEERNQNVHIYVPYSTGFGVGVFIFDELWTGIEFTQTSYEVNAPDGPTSKYQTDSVGLMLGYRYFLTDKIFFNGYLHYWPNVSSTLDGNKVTLQGSNGSVEHKAHEFGIYPNISIGFLF
jgi:hypothetical protein